MADYFIANLPSDGVVGALCAAMQDSSLHNLPFGEDDAVGLFQQRPSRGWGDDVALLDPRLATVAFYGGAGSGVLIDEVDHAFVVPHYRGPSWLAPLAAEDGVGQVDVDPATMASRTAPRVWSLGDVGARRPPSSTRHGSPTLRSPV